MPTIDLQQFSVDPDDVSSNGTTPVTVNYTVSISDASQNPVKVALFVNSTENISFTLSSWEVTLNTGDNNPSKDNSIVAHVSDTSPVKISMRVEDSGGLVSTLFSQITF
jgi:hypothetical protein